MNVDGAFFDVDVIAPDVVEQLCARVAFIGVCDEVFEQFEFGVAEGFA